MIAKILLIAALSFLALFGPAEVAAAAGWSSPQPHEQRGIHMTADNAVNPAMLARFIEFARANNLNTIVVDMNESLRLVDDEGASQRVATRLVTACLNPIGRFVVFKGDRSWLPNPINGEPAKPSLLLWSNKDHIWRDQGKNIWINPMDPWAWKIVIEQIEVVAKAGFRAVQLDYVRFPTDGTTSDPISDIDYGLFAITPEIKRAVITNFVRKTVRVLKEQHPSLRIATDLFGYSALITNQRDPSGKGQDIRAIAATGVDEIVSMAYPALFDPGYACDIPAKCPDKVIRAALTKTSEYLKVTQPKVQLCTYIQAFTTRSRKTEVTIPYGANEVKAQSKAAEEAGVTCWYLWNPVRLAGGHKKFPFQPDFFPTHIRALARKD